MMKAKTMKTKMTKTKVMKTKRKKRAAMPVELGTEVDLQQLCESTEKTYESLHNIDENDILPERRQEYWRNRHLARTACEVAENTAFADLVEEQKRRLPEVAASNAKLASDVQSTADALAMLDLVSTSLSVIAEVIALLGRVVPK